MNTLIIGASGLVGGNCLKHFKQQQDCNPTGTYFSYAVEGTYFYDTLDPNNPENLDLDTIQPEVIVHCGALTHVDYCEDHEAESYQKTVASTEQVVALCKKYQAKPVYISTDYVFDGQAGPYDEQAAVNPLSVYARHKLQAEQLVQKFTDNHLIIRITNVYGDEVRGKNFVARIVAQAIEDKTLTLKLPVDQYATPVNAWDVARAIYLLLQEGHKGIFHIASTDYMNRVQLALRILEHFDSPTYNLYPWLTKNLGQAAKRPLQGGLKSAKFLSHFPDFVFSTIDAYVQKIVTAHA